MINPGLYEELVNKRLRKELDETGDKFVPDFENLDPAEAPHVLAAYVERVTRRVLEQEGTGQEALKEQLKITNALVNTMVKLFSHSDKSELAEEIADYEVEKSTRQLLSLVPRENSVAEVTHHMKAARLVRPETSVSETSLFTGAPHEPQMYSELMREIASSDSILFLVSFIKWSGLVLILDELKKFADRGGTIRVVTTTYIGATDVKAVCELAKLPGARVKISYDTKRTRLHAKAYVFHRNTGYTTAYVGSSNLTNPAISSGLEWNVKLSRVDQPDAMDKVEATFETYWNSEEFTTFDPSREDDLIRLQEALAIEHRGTGKQPDSAEGRARDLYNAAVTFDLKPYPFQQQILDSLRAEREVGNHWRNLVVAATGTGKTMIAAFDYLDFCKHYNEGRRARLLFVVHREEILIQSLATFRAVLHDPNFGQLFVGGQEPTSLDHIFASIQTVNARQLVDHVSPDFYDYVVVDEIHHASAPTYRRLLETLKPQVLLGLTATPERADGKSVLGWFDNRFAAEIRLPEAIDRKLLSPFTYFGVSDEVDLSEVTWKRGRYDQSELENLYVYSAEAARRRATSIVRATRHYLNDVSLARGLGFCVSKAHARYMAEQFTSMGIPSIALDADSPDDVRKGAVRKLVSREINFIFVVDLYNEGVDIPEVDTVLFLRPTESLTIFLQQLGRGLRLSEGKERLTVLDFIGQANRHYNFESRFKAMLEPSGKTVRQQVENGFVSMPKGCYIHLERVAQQHVLDNIKKYASGRVALVERLSQLAEELGHAPTLAEFLDDTGTDPRQLYRTGCSFARLSADASLRPSFEDPGEDALTKGLLRLSTIDSRRWIHFLLKALDRPYDLRWGAFSSCERRMLAMLKITLWPDAFDKGATDDSTDCLRQLADNPTMLQETKDLLKWCHDRIDFVDEPVDLGFDCPLDLHCHYTRDQLLVALDYRKTSSVRQGVLYIPDHKVDVLMNTLIKSERDYSPSTMYEDYSISSELFHWQSQSTTSESSPTGKRYIHHREMGSRVVLFVRERKEEQGATAPYTFLGLADYVSHEGSRPMSIIWKLERPIPAKFLPATNKLAG